MAKRTKKPAAKKQAARKQETGMGELLGLLKTHPHLVRALGLSPAKVKRLLKGAAAPRLLATGDERFVIEVYEGPDDAHPFVNLSCRKRTI
jgi:hypothetical protein